MGALNYLIRGSRASMIVQRFIWGNKRGIARTVSTPHIVNLDYSHKLNLGDTLSPVVTEWMLRKKGLSLDTPIEETRHLLAIGSLLGRGTFDATVWGTGLLGDRLIPHLKNQRGIRTYDVRAVRGPKTAEVLRFYGFDCPDVFGDPVILMPRIFAGPACLGTEGKVGVVFHRRTVLEESPNLLHVPDGCIHLDIQTDDYASFIERMCSCSLIISESLHGIILAESYGVPAIPLQCGKAISKDSFKFEDWYASTERMKPAFAHSVEEALNATPAPLPALDAMADRLIDVFPYDLWD